MLCANLSKLILGRYGEKWGVFFSKITALQLRLDLIIYHGTLLLNIQVVPNICAKKKGGGDVIQCSGFRYSLT